MKCNIQDVLEIDLPDSMADSVDIFNNEWDLETGQAWEMNNFIKLTKDKKTLLKKLRETKPLNFKL